MSDKGRLLLVDDDANALDALAELLRDAGYELATARSDAEASMALVSFQPDVILSNVGAHGSQTAPEWTVVDGQVVPQQVLMSAAELPRAIGVPWVKKPIDLEALLALLSRLRDAR